MDGQFFSHLLLANVSFSRQVKQIKSLEEYLQEREIQAGVVAHFVTLCLGKRHAQELLRLDIRTASLSYTHLATLI